ncbi:YdcF family protein [Aquabacter spiritensis]|uniref:Uncharacterized SAM-binding protein YcdF (DUF218 family) n=1 Tax=Aquabacter spiritensis TaxID=933073 RepID=A0A4R3LVH2_9HYPH|nr:YdcF family protein [Aquabacter spiritensis]TCT02437.1 uncharacterized SAM-binding protein YcdF (DUF218 family) [Aquabacter spiritensis]
MDLFYTLSKVLWTLAVPSNFVLFVGVLGLVIVFLGSRRSGLVLIALAVAGQLVMGFSPLSQHLLSPLEERFPPFIPGAERIDGIILLGGAEVPDIALTRGIPAVNDAAERVIVFAALARAYPEAALVFSGTSGVLDGGGPLESAAIREALVDVGIDMARVRFETRARNTAENAAFTRDLVKPNEGARWLLVTSAFHIPRAVGCFRAVGFPVIAAPVDYRTIDPAALNIVYSRAASGMDMTDLAAKEWVGLLAYYMTGKIGDLFPAPIERR